MSRLCLLTCAVLPILAASFGAQAAPPNLPSAVAIDGDPFPARLVGIDENWQMTFVAGENERVLAFEDLVHWGAFRDREDGPQILLADGGMLHGDVLRITGGDLVIESDFWSEATIPLTAVRGIVFQPPVTPLARDKLSHRIEEADGRTDQLLLDNGDTLKGVLLGTVGQENQIPTALKIEIQNREVQLSLANVVAVMFNPTLVSATKPKGKAAWLGFRDGSLLFVESVVPKSDRWQLSLPSGVPLETFAEFTPDTLWDEVTLVRPLTPRVIYLSDLTPISYKHIPFLETSWPYAADRNVLDGRLRAGGFVYAKGLSMHSASRLAYDLGGSYRRFEAELAIDESSGHRGSVRCRVFVNDADGGWKLAHESPVIRGGDEPTRVSADVSGVQRMVLIVDFADRGDELDRINWLNARLVK